MFGGKTERMIALLRQAVTDGLRVRAFKHAIDNRYDPTHLVTHRQDRFDAQPVPDATAILDRVADVDVVAVDEGQFFKRALVPVIEELLRRGKTVLVAGITHDAWGRPFEPIPDLIARSQEEIVCRAPCRICGSPAPYTQRLTPISTLHMVGGLDDYEPRCRAHFTPLPGPPETRE